MSPNANATGQVEESSWTATVTTRERQSDSATSVLTCTPVIPARSRLVLRWDGPARRGVRGWVKADQMSRSPNPTPSPTTTPTSALFGEQRVDVDPGLCEPVEARRHAAGGGELRPS